MQPKISKCVPYCGTRNDQRESTKHQASNTRNNTGGSIIINNQPGLIC
jgi:hypothetical protein